MASSAQQKPQERRSRTRNGIIGRLKRLIRINRCLANSRSKSAQLQCEERSRTSGSGVTAPFDASTVTVVTPRCRSLLALAVEHLGEVQARKKKKEEDGAEGLRHGTGA